VSTVARLVPVPVELLAQDPLEVAPRLLNTLLVHGERAARIVEVEAYRGDQDPASHAFRGLTRRNATMFGPPGRLYVYFSYGMHWCANVVCRPEGVAGAVLLRAGAPVAGLGSMWAARRTARRTADLLSGPAKLCQGLGLTGEHDGADLVSGDRGVRLCTDGLEPPSSPGVGPRVGISVAVDRPWRWWVPGDPNVSGPRSRPVDGRRRTLLS
jgi:DNA-3-methyladenine glycosylase